ncbi:pyruvate, water dikinase regulatory protein [Ligilactobacillus agilis]|uniref:pyruvate, water dikinase regulatory protein n=1 Tax=Ligilactobacillus agilis TaxID=1601 RepID=UPI00265D2F9E|nr:pyruvate, water dikinase regulatory protein [Ligilactobacillus agilis]
MTQKEVNLYIISDSLGETAFNLAQAALVQFPDAKFQVEKFPLIRTSSILQGILNKAKRNQAFIVHTFVEPELSALANNFCKENNLACIDAISGLVNTMANLTGLEPLHKAGINHNTDTEYFNRIEAIEFAVNYDDGKDPSGFTKADIVLLGISRTSKTPLSLYLANRGYKVANLPLVPKTKIPDEIYQVDKNHIFGLTNDVEVLNDIRRARMISYGLNPDTAYSSVDNIKAELDFATDLYRKLGCLQINVAHKSIEETATLIIESLAQNKIDAIGDNQQV